MRGRVGLILLVAACTCAAARGGEPESKFEKWARPDRDPIVARLGLAEAQKKRLAGLYEAYRAQRAEIEKKHAGAPGPLAKRGMYRELMVLDSGAEKEFAAVLTADQRRRAELAAGIIKRCDEQVAGIGAEIEKRADWARLNPSGYLEFKKRCESAVAACRANRDQQLDRGVGELPPPPPPEPEPGKLDLAKGGSYRSGEWEYHLQVERKGDKAFRRVGRLVRAGNDLFRSRVGRELDTPWGRMKNLGIRRHRNGNQGWLPAGLKPEIESGQKKQ